MATTIAGETYLGDELVSPLTSSGDVTLYLWPMRCLNNKTGGPTFGIDVGGVEVLRFDPHGARGHWHDRGYDKLGAGASHQDFPDGVDDIPPQISWSLAHIRENGQQLLEEAEYAAEARSLDPEMVRAATEAIQAHLENEGDLRSKAIRQGLLLA